MSKVITIDTSDNKKITLKFDNNGKKTSVSSKSVVLRSEATLPLMDKILKQNKTKLSEIDGIKVKLGPGSFTGLRVGAAIANALGFLLKIPINGKKIGEIVRPVYNE